MMRLSRSHAQLIFVVMAFAYFLSTLIRAITATIAPTLVAEFTLNARDLGLLAGGYFLGFALTQLALGSWLDRYGPKRVELLFLSIAVLGCIAFSQAGSFAALLVSRVVCGVGVSACLMAPLTGYRRWLAPQTQLRSGAWMLMVGSLGMVASTLPVQWLLPVAGWRPIFLGLAGALVLSMVFIAWLVPKWSTPSIEGQPAGGAPSIGLLARYSEIWQSRYFRRLVPIGFFSYGGLVAVQTLWAGPWMVRVAGYTAAHAAQGLFWINVSMLLAYWLWGLVNPWLAAHGFPSERIIKVTLPVASLLLITLITQASALGEATALVWVLFCIASTAVTQLLPVIGMAFRSELAGRAMSAYNLIVFCGIFTVQWGIGLGIDALKALGCDTVQSYQGALGIYALCSAASYVFFLRYPVEVSAREAAPVTAADS